MDAAADHGATLRQRTERSSYKFTGRREDDGVTIQPSDPIFRRGHLALCGGLIDFGSVLKYVTGSKYTHVGVVYQKIGSEGIIVDVSPHGLQRLFIVDWLTDDSEEFDVMRTKADHRERVIGPGGVLENLNALVNADPIYDESFKDSPIDLIIPEDRQQARAKVMQSVYCSEPADWSYREAGLPLAAKVRTREFKRVRPWPNRWFWRIVAAVCNIDMGSSVALPGNKEIGLASSPLLEVVWSSEQTEALIRTLNSKSDSKSGQ